jgi:putative oxidoreductase
MSALQDAVVLGGRILLSIIFINGGYGKIGGWGQTAAMMQAKHVPAVPLSLAGTIAIELGGGLLLAVGLGTTWVATLLAVFLIPVTLLFHNYWAFSGMERMMQRVMFLKNVAIIGALLMISGMGGGRFVIGG